MKMANIDLLFNTPIPDKLSQPGGKGDIKAKHQYWFRYFVCQLKATISEYQCFA